MWRVSRSFIHEDLVSSQRSDFGVGQSEYLAEYFLIVLSQSGWRWFDAGRLVGTESDGETCDC
jgi:hypothetical protein